MHDLSIGSEVYIFDENRRIYRRDEKGNVSGGPIYREYFRKVQILRESPRKWITAFNSASKKDPYKTGFLTLEQVEEQCWDKDNRIDIMHLIQNKSVTTEQLRHIATIIGYTPNV